MTLKREAQVTDPFVSPPIHSDTIAFIQIFRKNFQH
jgi:hypothetical protein